MGVVIKGTANSLGGPHLVRPAGGLFGVPQSGYCESGQIMAVVNLAMTNCRSRTYSRVHGAAELLA